MRRWIKYSVVDGRSRNIAPNHFEQMGCYRSGQVTREGYIREHFLNVRRCVAYAEYAIPRIRRTDKVLSVASGYCATELYIAQKVGCEILCSDQTEPPCIPTAKRLFPELRFQAIDVLHDEPPAKFDVILAFGLIWAFDDEELTRFFAFTRNALRPGGRLLLDIGSPDNTLTTLYHDWLLPVESAAMAAALSIRHGRRFGVACEQHGYRRTVRDIAKFGDLSDYRESDYRTEADRSRVFKFIGRMLPYVRMVTLTNPQRIEALQ